MRQTLFYINWELFGWPMFGIGWLLIVWCVFTVALLGWLVRRQGWNADTRSWLPIVTIVGLAIYGTQFLLPAETGLPVRGYGMMLMLAILASSGTARWRARQLGIDPELIVSLTLWMVISGIVGARLFYVIQYREQYWSHPWTIFQFYEGGLVVYGALVGACLGSYLFLRKRKLSVLAMADLVAPGLILGLAIGRIGCFMNGCCWGGLCTTDQWGVQFPVGSPPYVDQLASGNLLGFSSYLSRDENGPYFVVAEVHPQTPASGKLQTGQKLEPMHLGRTPRPIRVDLQTSGPDQSADPPIASAVIKGTGRVAWTESEVGSRSLPVVPSQLYSSVNAFALFLVIWFAFPFRKRDGQIFALLLTLYPITRFVLEIIRSDEGSQFGTSLTISQIVSLAILCGAGLLWWYVMRLPRQTSFPTFATPGPYHDSAHPDPANPRKS